MSERDTVMRTKYMKEYIMLESRLNEEQARMNKAMEELNYKVAIQASGLVREFGLRMKAIEDKVKKEKSVVGWI